MNQRVIAAGVSAAAVALATPVILHFEGEIRHGYRDPIGIVTACVGHTGPDAKLGRTYTHDECLALLRKDLETHSVGLSACLRSTVPPHVEAALLSFAFNVGVAKACNSAAVRLITAGQFAAGCAELSKWVNAGGKPLPGLVRRRAAERALCEGRGPAPVV